MRLEFLPCQKAGTKVISSFFLNLTNVDAFFQLVIVTENTFERFLGQTCFLGSFLESKKKLTCRHTKLLEEQKKLENFSRIYFNLRKTFSKFPPHFLKFTRKEKFLNKIPSPSAG